MTTHSDWVPHGTDTCTCGPGGEQPECPHHGYEAVIARLRDALDTIREEALQAEHYGRPIDTGWLMEVASRG
jgi:hypothetical protein